MLAIFGIMLVIFECIKSVTKIQNRSPTPQSCHQHISAPTPVTNIDVSNIVDKLCWQDFSDFGDRDEMNHKNRFCRQYHVTNTYMHVQKNSR